MHFIQETLVEFLLAFFSYCFNLQIILCFVLVVEGVSYYHCLNDNSFIYVKSH